METNQMKNIIVLKDIPSNIVDEAIVILKNNTYIKDKEKVNNKASNKFNESNSNYEFIVKEAENIVSEYVRSIEKPKTNKNNANMLLIKYKKLQVFSAFLVISTIVCVIATFFR